MRDAIINQSMVTRNHAFKLPQSQHGFVKPILRWAGGKSNLVPQLIEFLPTRWERYVEPMVGGGALFFCLAPKESILADINDELINFYQILKDHQGKLVQALLRLKASLKQYYQLRAQKPADDMERAVRFAYLNRLCWNGLYRVNRRSEFNVPIGDRLPGRLWHQRDLDLAAQALQNARLMSGDFQETLKHVRKDDFVFLDPPYPRGSREALGFNRYSPGQFSLGDHKRLAEWVEKLTKLGAKVILTLADSSKILSQYPKSLERHVITSNSLISCSGTGRRKVREIVMRNYRS